MTKYYHGTGRQGPYFEGWYLKNQTKDGKALALIPALHIEGDGSRSASLQVISSGGAWWLSYPETAFLASKEIFRVRMGENTFDNRGISLDIEREGISLHGTLTCGLFTPLKSDIMGPFRFVPKMECSHGVVSMGHSLAGTLFLNGEAINFSGGTGYIETDRGSSFPSAYLWTQCAWTEGSLMLSVATIPLARGGLDFTGCICALRFGGREYRFATYRGVRIERWSAAGAKIHQGKYRLEAELLKEHAHPLQAPVKGSMGRTIHESLCATVRYRFWAGEQLLFEHTDPAASFEYADK